MITQSRENLFIGGRILRRQRDHLRLQIRRFLCWAPAERSACCQNSLSHTGSCGSRISRSYREPMRARWSAQIRCNPFCRSEWVRLGLFLMSNSSISSSTMLLCGEDPPSHVESCAFFAEVPAGTGVADFAAAGLSLGAESGGRLATWRRVDNAESFRASRTSPSPVDSADFFTTTT